jgi:hypothetical protein
MIKTKLLYHIVNENSAINITCYYNSDTDYIGIHSSIKRNTTPNRKKYSSKYYKSHIIERKKYNEINKVKIAKQKAKYNKKYKMENPEQMIKWKQTHKDDIIKYSKQYYIEHKIQRNKYSENYHRLHGSLPMEENLSCSLYLGVVISEYILANIFKNVQVMSHGNPGYDFICMNNKRIDVKSGCRQKCTGKSDRWYFTIKKNKIPDYFLCLAFDNREDLTPEHIWLIPGKDINNYTGVSITESRLERWDYYKINRLDEALSYRNTIINQKLYNG